MSDKIYQVEKHKVYSLLFKYQAQLENEGYSFLGEDNIENYISAFTKIGNALIPENIDIENNDNIPPMGLVQFLLGNLEKILIEMDFEKLILLNAENFIEKYSCPNRRKIDEINMKILEKLLTRSKYYINTDGINSKYEIPSHIYDTPQNPDKVEVIPHSHKEKPEIISVLNLLAFNNSSVFFGYLEDLSSTKEEKQYKTALKKYLSSFSISKNDFEYLEEGNMCAENEVVIVKIITIGMQAKNITIR